MRITSGIYGGRQIKAPKGATTRPMTDRTRAAIFDALGRIDGFHVLDAYAGSGAVGFEGLSRGAGQVIAVEQGRQAIEAIKLNERDLGITWGYSLYSTSVESWLGRQVENQLFDLILADPPYDQLKPDVIEKLGMLLQKEGILVLSHSSRGGSLELAGLKQIDHKIYGDTAITFYKPA
jgi:16S rRNA (guanine966-N2)-methyltransferase